jgi:adenine-specific DNA-methyltransferase
MAWPIYLRRWPVSRWRRQREAGRNTGWPEFGTVSRGDLVSAARQAGDAAFDILIVCAFGYDEHFSDFERLGRIPVLKARMNADLHMAADRGVECDRLHST